MGRTEIIILLIISSLVFIALLVIIILFVYQFRKKILQHEIEKEQARQQLLSAQLEIQQQTMQHIGHEIHDSVGQKLTLASLHAHTLLLGKQYPDIGQPLIDIRNLVNEALAELRGFSKNLTDNEFLHSSLESLITQECDRVRATGHCQVTLDITGTQVTAAFDAKTILLRLVQEFLQNSLKHAACKNIYIRLANSKHGLRINASDDGHGFDMADAANKGVGLQSMKHRAAIIGASLQIESRKEQGTSFVLFMPAAQ